MKCKILNIFKAHMHPPTELMHIHINIIQRLPNQHWNTDTISIIIALFYKWFYWMWSLPVSSLLLKPNFWSLKVDQPYALSSVFYCFPLSSTVCITTKIPPWGSSIRHAKVKMPHCHLEWCNVYQARHYTLAYGIWNWRALRQTSKEYLYLHQNVCVTVTQQF